MAYNGNISLIDNPGSLGNKGWTYEESGDSLATIKGSGYFNSATAVLRNSDSIKIFGSDGFEIIYVTSASGAATVTTGELTASASLGTGEVTSTHILDGTILNADVNASAGIELSKLEAVTDGQMIVGNGSNVPTAVTMSNHATLANNGALTLAANAVDTNEIANFAVTPLKLAAGAVTGSKIASYAVDDVAASMPYMLVFDTAGGATANADKTITYKMTITEVYVINKADGTPGDTIQLQTASGANNITNPINVGGVSGTKTGASDLHTTYSVIDAGGTLRIAQTDGGGSDSPACRVVVVGFKTA